MSDPNGQCYDAKLTARTIQFKANSGHTMASLKRIGNDAIEETDKREGKVVGVFKMTVSPDGRWINVEYKNKERGTTTTYKAEKQS
jgi:hypothetical protein